MAEQTPPPPLEAQVRELLDALDRQSWMGRKPDSYQYSQSVVLAMTALRKRVATPGYPAVKPDDVAGPLG